MLGLPLLVLVLLAVPGAGAAPSCRVDVFDAMFRLNVSSTDHTTVRNPAPLAAPLAAARGEVVHFQAWVRGAANGIRDVAVAVDGLPDPEVRQAVHHDLDVVFAPARHPPGLYADALLPLTLRTAASKYLIADHHPVFWATLAVPATQLPAPTTESSPSTAARAPATSPCRWPTGRCRPRRRS